MGIRSVLENDLKIAMREKNEDRKRVIRMALSNIRLAEIETKLALDDVQLITLLQKEIKTRLETIEDAKKIDRQDLIIANQIEIKIIQEYLPKQLDDIEIENLCKNVILEIGAQSPSDMGKVMKVVLPRIEGRASNESVSKVVKKLLTK